MKQYDRWKQLIAILSHKEQMPVYLLAKKLDVSLATIRRDLAILEKDRVIIRSHGYAKLSLVEEDEPSDVSKQLISISGKEQIAAYAASLVQPGDFVFLDSGTTIRCIIKHLIQPDLTVVTNCPLHVESLVRKGIRVILCSGEVKPNTFACVGAKTIEQIRQYHFDIAFVGSNGVSGNSGFSTHEFNEAEVKTNILLQAKKRYILADSRKMNQEYFITFWKMEDATLITDTRVSGFDYDRTDCIIVDETGTQS
ncbi:MAG: DeoR/GlpR family DNA-binding transcription regulator [Erysipelotrichaceae bacterium]|jgi:DeoR family fructose operon transcriptional repressor|nr:DeoR/GlpR family DNA-binding transcription regulator [Erysipelotrichaceae bacterium]